MREEVNEKLKDFVSEKARDLLDHCHEVVRKALKGKAFSKEFRDQTMQATFNCCSQLAKGKGLSRERPVEEVEPWDLKVTLFMLGTNTEKIKEEVDDVYYSKFEFICDVEIENEDEDGVLDVEEISIFLENSVNPIQREALEYLCETTEIYAEK